jgi:hypothetical protein
LKVADNPFLIRSAELTESDSLYLNVFVPEVLALVPGEAFAAPLALLISSPGGGKTSILRAFTPGALEYVIRRRKDSPHREIWKFLHERDVVDESGARYTGLLLSCVSGYAELGGAIEGRSGLGLFRAVLNARIVLRMLRAMCQEHGLQYPQDLKQFRLSYSSSHLEPGAVPRSENPFELLDWGRRVESSAYEALEMVTTPDAGPIPYHDRFDAVMWLATVRFSLDGADVTRRPLLMLDDVYRLRRAQRLALLDEVPPMRAGMPVWLAMRASAIERDVLSEGSRQNRDYVSIDLEGLWSEQKNRRLYQKFLNDIADKRLQQSDLDLTSFGGQLVTDIKKQETRKRFADVSRTIRDQLQSLAASQERYRAWFTRTDDEQSTGLGDERRNAIEWMKLAILIERDVRKKQPSLDLNVLPPDALEERDSSALEHAAESFVAHRFRTPFYFGMDRMIGLSTYNVDEFLKVAARIFDHMRAAHIMGDDLQIDPAYQDRIVRGAGKQRYEEIARDALFGVKAQNLVDGIARFAQARSFVPNSPYAPGVTGIALSGADLERLRSAGQAGRTDPYYELSKVIASCVWNNLLLVRADHSQNNKNWTVFYLNRLICAHFDLTLQYGGWQATTLRDLNAWSQHKRQTAPRELPLTSAETSA